VLKKKVEEDSKKCGGGFKKNAEEDLKKKNLFRGEKSNLPK